MKLYTGSTDSILIVTSWYTILTRSSCRPEARFPLPELTARVDGWPVSITRQHGPCWRAVNSASGNRALVMRSIECQYYNKVQMAIVKPNVRKVHGISTDHVMAEHRVELSPLSQYLCIF